jgi:hypothetical protein
MLEFKKQDLSISYLTEIKPAPENMLCDGFTSNIPTRPCRKSIPAKRRVLKYLVKLRGTLGHGER